MWKITVHFIIIIIYFTVNMPWCIVHVPWTVHQALVLKKKKNWKHTNLTNVNVNVLSKPGYNLNFFLNPTHSYYQKNKNYPFPCYLK